MLSLNADVDALTPVELRDGRWWKRDDLLRYSNGVNGKTRTSLHLARRAAERGCTGLVYGGAVKAPALGRVASAAAYTGLDCFIVTGTTPERANRHPAVQVAVEAGAQLIHSKVAYNPVLQKRCREIESDSGGSVAHVAYGVSTHPHAPREEVEAFLDVDSAQVANVVNTGARTLVMALGSGNAAAGVLYGLWKWTQGDLERVVLVGVGPDRRQWLCDRLAYVGVDLEDLPRLEYLNTYPDFARYNDLMPETEDGIDLHPTYEGKVIRYLNQVRPPWWTARDGSTCFWIVGGPR